MRAFSTSSCSTSSASGLRHQPRQHLALTLGPQICPPSLHTLVPVPFAPSCSPRRSHSTSARRLPAALQAHRPGDTSIETKDVLVDSAWFFSETGQQAWIEAMELNTLTPDMPDVLLEMGINYDPERLSQKLKNNWPEVYARALNVTTTLGGFAASIAQDYALGNIERNMYQRASELRGLLSRLGPSFVKIGQALSSRPDLLPKPYLDTLADLQDRLPSFPTEIARAVIEEELRRPVEAMYATFSDQPVAAASLGQVYRATLRSTGEEVAVKVQRPGIGESIAVDMLLLRRLMGVVDTYLLPALGLSQPITPLVDEFAGRLFTELDYVLEGQSCERFQELYGGMPRVRTPAIKWDCTARRVLTMEWIDGVKLTNKPAMDAAGLSVLDFVDVGIECTLRQLLEHGYFHADPHPGNLLATRSGDLVYLDFGMMSSAPQYARYAIMAHVVHLVNRDYDAMCQDYYTLEFMDRDVDTSPIAPALAAFFDDVLDQSVEQLNFKAIVDGLGEVLFKFPFHVPAYYALILRSLTVLEGLALQADPRYKLLGKAYPYMARRLLTDPAPELRGSFEDLMLKNGQFRWHRLENLMEQGSKSQDFDPSQLWLLAEWLLSDTAGSVRESIVTEIARMVDAVAAGDVRQRIAQATGNPAMAEQLVPWQPQEPEALYRAQALLTSLRTRMSAPPTSAVLLPSTSSSGSGGVSSSMPAASSNGQGGSGGSGLATGALPLFNGSGPFGLLTPQDVVKSVSELQNVTAENLPRLQKLMQMPGSTELMQSLTSQVCVRDGGWA
uniref:Protein kinase domain-containing protein n=1 Tax=Dunaliella tertiolecta TaxID=3047 RepID=A0A7S3QQ29_DUNTE